MSLAMTWSECLFPACPEMLQFVYVAGKGTKRRSVVFLECHVAIRARVRIQCGSLLPLRAPRSGPPRFYGLSFIGQSLLLPRCLLCLQLVSLPGCWSILLAASQTVGSSSSARPCGLGNRIFCLKWILIACLIVSGYAIWTVNFGVPVLALLIDQVYSTADRLQSMVEGCPRHEAPFFELAEILAVFARTCPTDSATSR